MALSGRDPEWQRLHQLLTALRSGRSEVLVLVGEAGIGKTALVQNLRDSAADCTVLSVAGVESDRIWRSPVCSSCAHQCSASAWDFRYRNARL
ncbi:ATP-binding protein [Mycolicibacterium mucogenicum]|uniref:ATP-binding protein n=1 Tax=Mycolicibacterium mucogenicum TaxID=56689 RepID=UPI00298BC982|nr:ATP-binding protein [Mycolicibacterium mucogenicum]